MKKVIATFIFLLAFASGFSCTTFFLHHKNGQMLFGRNYDWITETCMINTNLRGLVKSSLNLDNDKMMTWTSKYGSITFNQYGKEFPTGGMNEKGLVVELMWLSESEFPAADERPAFSVLQWIQYQLDNCSTVDEVIETDKKIRISGSDAPQHYLVADANGNAATIEFLEGKMKVHTDSSLPYPVLTNSTYEQSVKAVEEAATKKESMAFNDNSLERFRLACNRLKVLENADMSQPFYRYAFDLLDAVSQGKFTKWSIVYDITHKKVYFKTASHTEMKSIEFAAFDFSCQSKALSIDISQIEGGEISKKFRPYSNETNEKMLKEAFTNSKSQIEVPQSSQNAMAANAAAVKCGK